MIYLTTDVLDHAVYFDLRSKEFYRKGGQVYSGLLGNGIHEVPVTLRKSHGSVDVAFGESELFRFVEEETVRQMLLEAMKGRTLH